MNSDPLVIIEMTRFFWSNNHLIFSHQDQVSSIWKKCDTCTLLFPDLATLTMHKQSTHKKKGKSFNNSKNSKKICKFCSYQVNIP